MSDFGTSLTLLFLLRTYEMICFYFCGMADQDELIAHIEKLNSYQA